MWPSRIPRRRAGTATVACCVPVMALLGVQPAEAHTLSVTQGTATIEGNALTLRFTVEGEYLRHSHLLGTQDDATFALRDVQRAAAEYGAALLERIVVRGERGETIAGRIDAPQVESTTGAATITMEQLRHRHVDYVLSYPLPGKSGYVSLQQTASPQTHSAPSQIALAFRSNVLPQRTIHLTGGGNVEIVPLISPWPNESIGEDGALGALGEPCDRNRFVLSEAQQTVRAVVHIEANGPRVELYLPAPILETWIALPRAHRDYFEPGERNRALNAVREFLVTRNRMYINGRLQQPRIDRAVLLDVGDYEPADVIQPGRSSSWTSRIYASIRYPSTETLGDVDLQWDLFNSVVLTAQILVVADSDCRTHDISTYRPNLRWTRK